MSERVLTIPNLITFFRLALIPVFLGMQLTGRPGWALGCFAVAMASDVVDGFLARLLDQRTKLGGVLDPIADKLLVFSALAGLVYHHRVPAWLFLIIIFRDALMIVGAIVVKHKNLEIPAAPTRIGKYATFALTCLVVLALTGSTTSSPELDAYTAVVGLIAGFCVVVSSFQYLSRFGYLFFIPSRSSPSMDATKKVEQ